MNEEEKKVIEELSKKAVICNYEERDYPNMICFKKDMIIALNLIEKLQKENEELKQDRNNNYQMIALAQNEMLGYMQGYEDGKKLKRSAVAYVVENQQYYIMNKKIEHYKEYIQKLQKENEELEEINNELEAEKNEAIRRYNFETIPIKKVKDKLKKLEIEKEKAKGRKDNIVERYTIENKINILQELLKESEE